MLNQFMLRIGALAFVGFAVVACGQNDTSFDDQGGSFEVGESVEITGGDMFQGDPTPPTNVDVTSITPTVDVTSGSQEDLRAAVGDRIFFDTDSSELNARATSVLNELAVWMTNNSAQTIRVEGHADERGTREYNLALGDRRANAVVNYLIGQGIDSSRLSTISFGKERPVAGGSNVSAWTQNRRAVFRIQ